MYDFLSMQTHFSLCYESHNNRFDVNSGHLWSDYRRGFNPQAVGSESGGLFSQIQVFYFKF